ncbi:MAG: hypothetical protein L0Y72_11975 [Gemmataceae bacterium]|nr:hypothetical protein [Gemmataceae bacterium]MCI0739754.1 hypothetical protein [Gemmataceae bacterium]
MATRILKKVRNAKKRNGEKGDFVPGGFGCHELLDRAMIMAKMTEKYVLEHAACSQNVEWQALAEKAVEALNELYQRIGATHLVR